MIDIPYGAAASCAAAPQGRPTDALVSAPATHPSSRRESAAGRGLPAPGSARRPGTGAPSSDEGGGPSISVIVPAFNAERTLETCLAALETQTMVDERFEIIVVDDGSTDGTADVARARAVRLIQQPNAGPAAARNRGAGVASGDLLLFTDADCAPAPNWIAQMAKPFSEPDVAGAKGVYRTRQRSLVARFVQLEYERRYARMARNQQIDFIDTYSAAYRRDVFLANGGFDTRFSTASVEDQELSFRLARKGYRLVIVPQAVVHHLHDVTPGEYFRRKLSIGIWKVLVLHRHPERAVRDSHTPQVLKLQIALVGSLCLSLLASLLWPPALWGALAALTLFLASALPFLVQIVRRDRPVALVAPALLLLRALALGLGLTVGLFRFRDETGRRRAAISGLNRALKRTADLVGALVGLIVAAPLLAALGAAIKLDSQGSVLLFQERVGQYGRPFRLVKLCTVAEGADGVVTNAVDPPAPKPGDEPRITQMGRFLRHTGLDDLPQFWNVLKGDMSLVGPCPEDPRVVRQYSDWHRQRLAFKPGMVGPVQATDRADLSLDERVKLELDYIRGYTLWRDLRLLARAAGGAILGRGAR